MCQCTEMEEHTAVARLIKLFTVLLKFHILVSKLSWSSTHKGLWALSLSKKLTMAPGMSLVAQEDIQAWPSQKSSQ